MPIGHYNYDATITFPNRGWQVVAYISFVICLSINAGILARRAGQYCKTFTTFRPSSPIWLSDVLVLTLFLISFLFIVINGILTFGIGTHLSETCDASVVLCVSVFVLTKVVLYLYYLERLFLLSWATRHNGTDRAPTFFSRFRCWLWISGACIFVFGVPCAILLGFSKDFSLLYRDGEAVGCHVFLKWYLATPTIVWAGIINTYVIAAFIWTLRGPRLSHQPALIRLCKATVWSALISGICTVINLSVLLIVKGEHGIECLLCCSIDVLVNSLVVAIITDSRGEAASFESVYYNDLGRHATPSEKSVAGRDIVEDHVSMVPIQTAVTPAHPGSGVA